MAPRPKPAAATAHRKLAVVTGDAGSASAIARVNRERGVTVFLTSHGDLVADALAQGQLAHRRRQMAADAEHLGQEGDALAGLAQLQVIDVGQQLEGVERRQVEPELRLLTEHRADAVGEPAALAPRVEPEHRNGAGVVLQDAGQQLDGGRLAGAVGADEGNRLAGRHLEVDVVDRVHRPPAGRRHAAQCAHGAGRPGPHPKPFPQIACFDDHWRCLPCLPARVRATTRAPMKRPCTMAGPHSITANGDGYPAGWTSSAMRTHHVGAMVCMVGISMVGNVVTGAPFIGVGCFVHVAKERVNRQWDSWDSSGTAQPR